MSGFGYSPKPLLDLDLLKGARKDLEQVGYPPRPDEKSTRERKLWDSIASRHPKQQQTTPITFAPHVARDGSSPLASQSWSGGVLPVRAEVYSSTEVKPLSEKPFGHVYGSWIIPNLRPQLKADQPVDGVYELYNWVGLDGWETNETVKIGILLELTVESGKVTNHESSILVIFRRPQDPNFSAVKLDGLPVAPGDVVTGFVGPSSSGKSLAWFINESTNTWTSYVVNFELPGRSAEWITTGQGPSDQGSNPFPNYGATVFFEGFAAQGAEVTKGIERSLLSNAVTVDGSAERGHSILARASSALRVSAST
ncbi:hypothetical protein TWF718_005444 [Orbilia javanica]|uniref:Uncharacterized protein n=1 Tax=Orbilia javanica TaxID=47235 RepID=A0AAN8RE79_9PEZI